MIRWTATTALTCLAALVAADVAPAASIRFDRDGHARIPFELLGGHVWVRGTVGGSDSLWVMVDSGASSAAMDDGVARALGLEPHGRHETTGGGGTQASRSVSDVTLRIAGLTLHRESMDTVDLGALSAQSGHPLQLILGYELFEFSIVRFDYAASMIDVWDPAYAPPSPRGAAVPMTLEENHPYVEGTLTLPGRAPLRGRFVIDTGSNAGLILAPEVAARDSLLRAFPRTLQTVGRGVGGERRNHLGRAEAFALGGLRFDRPLVMVPDPAAGRFSAPGTLGNIGGQLLGRCRVTFDYPGRRVLFEPAAGFERPFEADMSGIAFTRDPAGWLVRFVHPDSPASEAGVREGDIVTSVDGEPSERIDPATMRRLLQQPGRSIRVGLRRAGETSTVTLALRRLL